MPTVRWVTGDQKRTSVRDQFFGTKREMFEVLNRENISVISRVPTAGGKMYAVTLKK